MVEVASKEADAGLLGDEAAVPAAILLGEHQAAREVVADGERILADGACMRAMVSIETRSIFAASQLCVSCAQLTASLSDALNGTNLPFLAGSNDVVVLHSFSGE